VAVSFLDRPVGRLRDVVSRVVVARWSPAAVAAACAAIFLITQWHVERPFFLTSGSRVQWSLARVYLAQDLSRFVALSLACAVLAVAGRRTVFWLPAVAYVLAPVILGWSDGNCMTFSHVPAAVGIGWGPASSPGCFSDLAAGWGPALMDLGLVLAPAGLLAFRPHRPDLARQGDGLPAPTVEIRAATLAVGLFAGWALVWAWAASAAGPESWGQVARPVAPLLGFGMALGTFRLRWSWALIVVPILLWTGWLALPLNSLHGFSSWTSVWDQFRWDLPYTWPYLAVPVVGAAWLPTARALARLRTAPVASLIAVNALNIADALLTRFALEREGAVESNPLVRLISLPGKVLLVAALSWALWRQRPKTLPWLVLAFLAVLVWHVAGFFASPR
jgi:hypothetical protein